MTTFQTLQEGLSDPRHLGTTLFAPCQWLHKEIKPISAPFKGDIIGKELIEKVARIALIFIMPFAYLFTAVGYAYNLAAHFLNPLEKQAPKTKTQAPLPTVGEVPAEDSSTQENIYEKLFNEVNELRQEFDRIFQQEGLPGLRGDQKAQLLRRFHELEEKITPYQDKSEMVSACKVFFMLKNQFLAAVRQRRELAQAPLNLRMKDNGEIPIPDRGDCFYIAAIAAYPLYVVQNKAIDGSDIKLSPEELRQKIVTWQKENIDHDDELKGLIEAGIDIYIADKEHEIQGLSETIKAFKSMGEDPKDVQQQIDAIQKELEPFREKETRFAHHFEQASQPGFWGGVAEFYAFSKMYNVHILVREKNRFGEKPENECFRFNVGAPKQMILWWIDGHHFEVKID